MNRFASVVLIILIFESFTARKTNADLVIDLGPNGSGGLTMALTGSGNTSTTVGGIANIAYGSITDTFLPNGFAGTASAMIFPFSLSGNQGSYILFVDRNGQFGEQSDFTIGFGGSSFPGSPLNTLTGTYNLPNFSFTSGLPPLIAGTYALTRIDPSSIDVGNVTLRISSVPEPSSFVLFGLAVMFAIATRAGFARKLDGIREIFMIPTIAKRGRSATSWQSQKGTQLNFRKELRPLFAFRSECHPIVRLPLADH